MRNFVYSGGLSGGLLRHIKNDFFSLFQNEVKSVLNIKESYSMKKKPKKCSKKFTSSFIKRRGGGAKAVYKLYKKTGNLVSDRIPYTRLLSLVGLFWTLTRQGCFVTVSFWYPPTCPQSSHLSTC